LLSFAKKVFSAVRSIYLYPAFELEEPNYDAYWQAKRRNALGKINDFQRKRAEYILQYLSTGDSVVDVGCGDGGLLLYMSRRKKIRPIGVDISRLALSFLEQNGITTVLLDLNSIASVESLPSGDHVLALEVLEHLQNPERFLRVLLAKARKSVFFSFPNTGYITHRLRLLFGRFPLQWRVHPGEHVRFWTYKDLEWWLAQQGLDERSSVHVYEGVPYLNRAFPGLFGAAFIVRVEV
jgi:methionine biosynthesis protein MetW